MGNFVKKNSAGWAACGQLVKQRLAKKNYLMDKCEVIPMAVDPRLFYPLLQKSERPWGLSRPVIGFCGRFCREKGVDVVLKALSEIVQPFSVLFLGSGSMQNEIIQWIDQKKMKERAKVLLAPHGQVANYMRELDLLLAPSQTTSKWEEQFGRMIVEAFACKVPVISSNSGEIPYVVKEGGIVLDEKDVKSWIETIDYFLKDQSLRDKYSNLGYQRYLQNYTPDIVASQYINFYKKLL